MQGLVLLVKLSDDLLQMLFKSDNPGSDAEPWWTTPFEDNTTYRVRG